MMALVVVGVMRDMGVMVLKVRSGGRQRLLAVAVAVVGVVVQMVVCRRRHVPTWGSRRNGRYWWHSVRRIDDVA